MRNMNGKNYSSTPIFMNFIKFSMYRLMHSQYGQPIFSCLLFFHFLLFSLDSDGIDLESRLTCTNTHTCSIGSILVRTVQNTACRYPGYDVDQARPASSYWPSVCTHTAPTTATKSSSSIRIIGSSKSNRSFERTKERMNARYPLIRHVWYRRIYS